MPNATLYLTLTHKSSKHQHACTGSARQRMTGRTGSGLYPATLSAAGFIPSVSGSKGGNRPVNVSTVGQVSYHPVSVLTCSNDVSCAPKRPWDVSTKDASQLEWLGPGTMKCQPLSGVTIADSTCVATGTQWQDFRRLAASFSYSTVLPLASS